MRPSLCARELDRECAEDMEGLKNGSLQSNSIRSSAHESPIQKTITRAENKDISARKYFFINGVSHSRWKCIMSISARPVVARLPPTKYLPFFVITPLARRTTPDEGRIRPALSLV